MKKEDILQKDIEYILLKMDFISRYQSIWEKYGVKDESYVISDTDIIRVFEELGYEIKKKNKEQYFSNYIKEKDMEYRMGISIKYNIIHFDFSIKSEKFGIHSGGDFGLLVQLMTNWEMPIKSPGFNNLNSFQSLIADLVKLFNEIRNNIQIHFRT